MITGTGPSNRHEIWYFAESVLGAARIDDYKYTFMEQPDGWIGNTVKLDVPTVINLRLDPFERTAFSRVTLVHKNTLNGTSSSSGVSSSFSKKLKSWRRLPLNFRRCRRAQASE